MKRILVLVLAFLLYAQPALAAITSVGSAGVSAVSTTSGNTLVFTTNVIVEAGNVLVVPIAADNVGTTDADHSEVSGVVDQGSNVYAKLCEFTNGQGSVAAGATVSLWFAKLTTQLDSGHTVTANFANTIDSRAMRAWEFTVGAGNTLQLAGTCQQLAADLAQPGSATISGLSSTEYLFWRSIAQESNSGTAITVTASYTSHGQGIADTGTGGTSMKLQGEFRILTGTGDTSNPTVSGSSDNASVYVALEEVAEVAASTAGPFRRRAQ